MIGQATRHYKTLQKPGEGGMGVPDRTVGNRPGMIFSQTLPNTCARIVGVMLLLLLVLPGRLLAQKDKLKFERLAREHGLRGSSITCILQDRQGFMWFGTHRGLNKYDGYGFTVYKHNVLDSNSLSGNDVLAIHEDSASPNTLWIGTLSHGLNKLDRTTGQFIRFLHDPGNPHSLSNNQVLSLHEDRTGTLWIGTSHGLNRFDREHQQFTRFVHDPNDPHSLSSNGISSIYEDRPGTLWVGTGGGLNRLDRASGRFTRFVHDPDDPHSLSENTILAIHEDSASPNTLWVGTGGGGLNRFDREQERFTRFVHDPGNPHSLSSNVVWSIHEDRTGTLWVGTEGGGLNTLDRATSHFTRIVHDPENPRSLSSNYVTSIVEDRTGTLWIGTGSLWGGGRGGGFGINRLDRGQQQFRHFVHDPENPRSLGDSPVHTIFEDSASRTTLWVGTWGGGLHKLDRATGQSSRFLHDSEDAFSLSSNFVMSIHEDRSGVLCVGTADRGLNLFDREREQFTRMAHEPDDSSSLSHNRVVSIHEDSASPNTLWIATFGGGLNRLDREREKVTHFVHDPDDPHSLSTDLAAVIYEDRTGTLWIGTWGGGLNRFERPDSSSGTANGESGQFTRFGHDPGNPLSLSNDFVWSIHEDRAGTLWVATTGGLNQLDRATGEFRYYTEKDGLPDNLIYAILEDEHGRLWLSTKNGLSRFDPSRPAGKTFRNYDIADGLQNIGFSFGAPFKSKSGEMFFGGQKGIDYFHPDSIRDNPHIPPVVITRFTHYNSGNAGGEPMVDACISEKQHLELSYDHRTLTFEFVALNFRNTRKNQYAYKLEGFNECWIQLGTKHDVTFTNLDPGEYTLRVKGSNNDGIWNEAGASLKLTIIPPWWRTRWTYGVYALLFLAALYGIRHYELRRLQLRNELKIKNVEAEKLQEVDRLKSRFFASISHEFRTPLTLILGPVEKWLAGMQQSEMKSDFHLVQRNARRLQELINQLLDLSKLEAGKMSLQARPENIVALIRMITMTFESLAKQKGIALQLRAPEEEIIAYVERDKLEKIVTNLLSNAFKFTQSGGNIEVGIFDTPSQPALIKGRSEISPFRKGGLRGIEIRVSDTGIGIPEHQLAKVFDRFHQVDNNGNHDGTGIGLALTKELVELHHGRIAVESEVGKGTKFTVCLPLGRTHLREEEIVSDARYQIPGCGYSESVERGVQTDEPKPPLPLNHSAQQIFSTEQKMTLTDGEQMTAKPNDRQSQMTPAPGPSTILLVEDNPDMRAYIRGCLAASYRMIEAEDGAQGVKQAHKHAPDLIISDVMMPEMDGFALCEQLKTDARTSHIPVILLTARASNESKVEGLETGADDYLTKPFEVKELQVRVRNLIEQRRRLQERFRRELLIQPSEVTVTSMDEAFLKKVMSAVEAHLDDPSFDTDDLARETAIGRRQLNRKLRALTGQSVREFIRTIRLERAAQLLQQQAGTVTEIAYEVGFNSLAHFAKIFREEFGVAPSEYGKNRLIDDGFSQEIFPGTNSCPLKRRETESGTAS